MSRTTARTGPLTLAEVAGRLGISPERVKRLELDALERLSLERELQALRETA